MKADARSIIRDAQVALHDVQGTRWGAPELVRYLNDGQLAIAERRPDAVAESVELPLTAGARQQLPAQALALIDIPRNVAGRQRALTRVDRQVLDASAPLWLTQQGQLDLRHYMHDLREPRVFYVYPPARAGAVVELQFARYPQDVDVPAGATADTVTGTCDLDREWATALLHYVLARAYTKDAEAGALALATAHIDLFKRELGEPLETATAISAAA